MDGILLNRIISIIQKEVPLRINRITQPSDHEFIFQCFGKGRKNLYVSTHPLYSRIQITELKPKTNLELTHFLSILRKHLDGGTIKAITQENFDRVFTFEIDHRDDMGVIRPYKLMIELMGRYTNIILVDDEGKVIDALKRLGSFESSDRAIVNGSVYVLPPSFNKKSITELQKDDIYESIRKKYDGVSPLLEEEITYRLKEESVDEVLKDLLTSETLYIHDQEFHAIELKHLNTPFKTYPIMEGLDTYYKELQEQERIKAQTGNLLKLLRRELKRSKAKLPKLYTDLENAENSDHYREYGDLLYAFHNDAPSGLKEITLNTWDNTPITIALDEKMSGKQNANRYFIRYRKAKNSLSHLEKQIDLTENRIAYFEGLILQTQQADVEDAKEIKQELMDSKIIVQKMKKKDITKKKKKLNYTVIEYDEETTIFVGKNNLQNDAITFKIAKKEDTWFHVANTFGSHVVIKTPSLDNAKLRLCAMLAAYYSDARNSTNVEVQYTEIKNIKKIPGQQPGMVRFSTHNSIAITPNYELIKPYLGE